MEPDAAALASYSTAVPLMVSADYGTIPLSSAFAAATNRIISLGELHMLTMFETRSYRSRPLETRLL